MPSSTYPPLNHPFLLVDSPSANTASTNIPMPTSSSHHLFITPRRFTFEFDSVCVVTCSRSATAMAMAAAAATEATAAAAVAAAVK